MLKFMISGILAARLCRQAMASSKHTPTRCRHSHTWHFLICGGSSTRYQSYILDISYIIGVEEEGSRLGQVL